jgi:ATP-dependent DNA helicase RecG
MIPELLREIIARGESLNVEFTVEEKKAPEDPELVEAVICLANRSGEVPV